MARVAGYKEDMAKGKMLRFEDSLPRLPVPTLEGGVFPERLPNAKYPYPANMLWLVQKPPSDT
jgi:hypothetical protein